MIMTKPQLPSKLKSWLTSSGSLTALLEAKAGQPLKVERTFEGYKRLTLTQKKQLGMSGNSLNRPIVAWVREVLLYGNENEPWIHAQSIFPLSSLQGNAKRLKNLKGTPIGYVLFSRQQRMPNKRSICSTNNGWQRQTVYDWHSRKIIITETFLPSFL